MAHSSRRPGPLASVLFVAFAAGGCGGGDDEPATRRGAEPESAAHSAPARESNGSLGANPRAANATRPRETRARAAILLVVDTLRADRLSAYGYDRPTPHIDALAQEGTLYTANRAQGSWTRPSMQSLMSGLYVDTEYDLPSREVPMLAEVLSEAGVETAAFVANPVLGRHAGFDRGFDHYELYPKGEVRAGHVLRQFIAWLDARGDAGAADAERPWFAWLHLMDPHHPYDPLDQDDAYGDELERPFLPTLVSRWRAGWERLPELDPDHGGDESFEAAVSRFIADSNAYDGEVRSVDRCVRMLVGGLRERGLLEDTLIVLASDHGEMLWEYEAYPRGLERTLRRQEGLPQGLDHLFTVGHTGWLYEPIWRTPLIVRGPGFRAGARVDGLSANLDIHPTLLRAFGVDPAGALDGRALQGSQTPPRVEVFGFGRGTTAVADERDWRLVAHSVPQFLEGRPTRELLRPQPENELPRNLAETYPPQVERLEARIEAWRESVTLTGSTETSAASREVLEQLGYTVPGEDGADEDGADEDGADEDGAGADGGERR